MNIGPPEPFASLVDKFALPGTFLWSIRGGKLLPNIKQVTLRWFYFLPYQSGWLIPNLG